MLETKGFLSFVKSKTRTEAAHKHKRIAESLYNMKRVRGTLLSHLSERRAVPTSHITVRSAADAILKMLEDFHLRVLYYV